MWSWVPVWSQIEIDIGIVVASLPSLHPLVQQVWKGFSTTRRLTPSQLPDFPEYQSGFGGDVEKEWKANEVSFYEEASDVEDEIELAKSEGRMEVRERRRRVKGRWTWRWWGR
jgi:hypothetical protein